MVTNNTIKRTGHVQSISDPDHKNSRLYHKYYSPQSLSAPPCCQYRHIIYSLINPPFAVSTTDLLTWSVLIFSCRILLFDLMWLRLLCTRSSRLVSLAVWMLCCALAWCWTHSVRCIWGQRTMCSAALIWRIPLSPLKCLYSFERASSLTDSWPQPHTHSMHLKWV